MLHKDKVAVVTGAASGIGRAAAMAFAREGAMVTVADVDREKAESVVSEITAAGGNAIFVPTDVTSELDIKTMLEVTTSRFGGIDFAFNNAGMSDVGTTVTSATREQMERIIQLNVISVWLCMKYQIPLMAMRGGGAIVNTASRAGEGASPRMLGYTTTKHAVIGMTRSAAIDFAAQKIRVNVILPGPIDTPMLRASSMGGVVPTEMDVSNSMIPMGRLGKAAEVGETAVWLCSAHAGFITGACIDVDGGMSATI